MRIQLMCTLVCRDAAARAGAEALGAKGAPGDPPLLCECSLAEYCVVYIKGIQRGEEGTQADAVLFKYSGPQNNESATSCMWRGEVEGACFNGAYARCVLKGRLHKEHQCFGHLKSLRILHGGCWLEAGCRF